MPRTTPVEFKQEKNKKYNRPINLFTLYNYDGLGNNLKFAGNKTDITFDGITYTAAPIGLEPVSESTTGEIDSIRIKVGNADRLAQYYIEHYEFRGKKIGIDPGTRTGGAYRVNASRTAWSWLAQGPRETGRDRCAGNLS